LDAALVSLKVVIRAEKKFAVYYAYKNYCVQAVLLIKVESSIKPSAGTRHYTDSESLMALLTE